MTRKQLTEEVEQQIRQSLLSYAFFRPESAIVIAIAIILAGLSALDPSWIPGTWWLWLTFGAVGESLIVLSTLRDKKFYRKMVEKMFQQEFDIDRLSLPDMRQKLAKALEYRQLITQEIKREEDPVLDDYLLRTTQGLEDWIAQIYRLAQRIEAYQNDPIITRDLETVPKELARFKRMLKQAEEGSVRDELEKTVAIKQAQWDTLQNLRETMAKAQLQLENTLSTMGTIYTQVALLGSKDVDSSRAQRLQEDMTEQVQTLEDLSATMDEVYRESR